MGGRGECWEGGGAPGVFTRFDPGGRCRGLSCRVLEGGVCEGVDDDVRVDDGDVERGDVGRGEREWDGMDKRGMGGWVGGG